MNTATQEHPNPELQLAQDFIQYTGQHLFLTGKAGTGKTTFLHHLKEHSPKRMMITAPTGVAAINAGGVTLHSFFQLPFGPYVPSSDMLQQHRLSKEKINIIRSLNLLVIDEISMVRADLLDHVDAVLRRYRRRDLPFGGVQLLMIGDLHQLAPVVKEDDWTLLQPWYDSCYFFSSRALQQTTWVTIELQQVYRQSDPQFIGLLNRVRDNQLDQTTLGLLNARYQPDFQPVEDEKYITLTTHNRSADSINNRQLATLKSKAFSYQARIEGDYPEHSYPTAEQLLLKQGAQVMFVRNDGAGEKRYFNGKTGIITELDQEKIRVHCPGDREDILVGPVTWENIKYSLEPDSQQITEQVVGSFSQVPLRPAWAITIHKSQGLTFERAIIDGQAAFSHGQIYVALSRCKSLEGMVLSSPLTADAVLTDDMVTQFVMHNQQNPPDKQNLLQAKVSYQQRLLLECFDYQALGHSLKKLAGLLIEHRHLIQGVDMENLAGISEQTFKDVIAVADKFSCQLQSLFQPDPEPQEDARIQARVQKASSYFSEKLQAGLIPWLTAFAFETDNKTIKKQLNNALDSLQQLLAVKQAALASCTDGFVTGNYLNAIARAQIDNQTKPQVKKRADELSMSGLQHPELFQRLKEWRARQAQTEEVAHFRILHQQVLLQIVNALPATETALLQIHKVGPATVEKYGEPILKLVADYCHEHQIQANTEIGQRAAAGTKPVKQDTKQASYDLYLQGLGINEIAQRRGLAISTIENHLAHFVRQKQLAVTDLVAQEKIDDIKQAEARLGRDSLKVLKEALGDNYSYGEIRIVLESVP
ncbi:helix-turn-helix domain-containing protein [Methylophaga sp. OBS4]|uniref:helix-turn-helix domain-containing protein n=1 Tax=Methylophaga sp. OBS4 TaxID=2991935 RepID=UPI002259DBDC|nr:helix-turn-helix domain-containing protein [Methylophaga sp. OBS4]MCX4187218.1 helix-turn-helix domain-containing protein [Methylophaga sp. OBS4]